MDHYSPSSSKSSWSSELPPEIPQYLKSTPEEKADMVPGSTITVAVVLRLRVFQVIMLECEIYMKYIKVSHQKCIKLHKMIQNHRNLNLKSKFISHTE